MATPRSAQLVPPPNSAGLPLPPLPEDPPTFSDLAYATDYVARLKRSRAGGTSAETAPPPAYSSWIEALHTSLTHTVQTNAANVRDDIAATRNEIRQDIQQLRMEQILLANSKAGNGGPLYDPTVPGQLVLFAAPNPTCRDDLLTFNEAQCLKSAASLGLPLLPFDTSLAARKRQIAAKIGVPPMM